MSKFSPVIVHVGIVVDRPWARFFFEHIYFHLLVIFPPVFHTYLLSGTRTVKPVWGHRTGGHNLTAFLQLEGNCHIPCHFIHLKFKTQISSYILNLTIWLHSTMYFHIFNKVHEIRWFWLSRVCWSQKLQSKSCNVLIFFFVTVSFLIVCQWQCRTLVGGSLTIIKGVTARCHDGIKVLPSVRRMESSWKSHNKF